MGDHRKRAPGRAQDHPDWVFSLSGGIDSTGAVLVALDAVRSSDSGGNFAKAPFAIYLDTRVGVPLNRLYVEQLTDWLGIQLWTLRTEESFLEWLQRDGAPGGGAHGNVKRELKGRQSSRLTTSLNKPFYVLGFGADESDTRAKFPKIREKRRHVEVYPVHRTTRRERAAIILLSECPINLLWTYPAIIKDCGCLANGDPSELEITERYFPEFAQRMREWEESITHDGLKGTLGWSGLTADQQKATRDGYEQETLSTCGVTGCERARDPVVVETFQAVVEDGVSRPDAVDMLGVADSPVVRAHG